VSFEREMVRDSIGFLGLIIAASGINCLYVATSLTSFVSGFTEGVDRKLNVSFRLHPATL